MKLVDDEPYHRYECTILLEEWCRDRDNYLVRHERFETFYDVRKEDLLETVAQHATRYTYGTPGQGERGEVEIVDFRYVKVLEVYEASLDDLKDTIVWKAHEEHLEIERKKKEQENADFLRRQRDKAYSEYLKLKKEFEPND